MDAKPPSSTRSVLAATNLVGRFRNSFSPSSSSSAPAPAPTSKDLNNNHHSSRFLSRRRSSRSISQDTATLPSSSTNTLLLNSSASPLIALTPNSPTSSSSAGPLPPIALEQKEEGEQFRLHPLWGDRSPILTNRQPPPQAEKHPYSSSLNTPVRSQASSALRRAHNRHSTAAAAPPPSDLAARQAKFLALVRELTSYDNNNDVLHQVLADNAYDVPRAVQDFVVRAELCQIRAGSTLSRVEADCADLVNAWSACSATVFKLRTGPRYRELKQKKPSQPETLYDVVAVDMYASQLGKEEHIGRFMQQQQQEEEPTAHHPLPNVFVGNFMLPLNEPKLFGATDNGPTVQFVLTMRLSQWARANPTHHSVALASRLLAASASSTEEEAMRERLKIIVQVANLDELQLGKMERGLCNKYNGLPFLFRAYNSRYHRGGTGWFQADFDGHRSGYATRMARHSMLGLCASIVANVAFLVEGELDEELPEVLLGCATVHRLQCRQAVQFVRPTARFPLKPASGAFDCDEDVDDCK